MKYDLTVKKQREKLLSLLRNQVSGFISQKISIPKKSTKLELLERVKKVFIETFHYIENIIEEMEGFFFGPEKKALRKFNMEIVSLENLLIEM